MDSVAIQVLECVDDRIVNGRDVNVKKIQTVRQYLNGPSLEQVLLHEDVKDLPILVFSISGKTRGGKSFLLNLMIKYLEYLENKDTNDWGSGKVPNCFPWKNGIESITRGLWIYPKIFRLKDCYDEEVGVLLMDMEGMYDGEATDGEIIAISGVSAAISYLQMFNMKEKITADYLESVIRTLTKRIEELDSESQNELKNNYKIMLIVRDWIGEETYDYGTDGGKEYIDHEAQRGTNENQTLWQLIHSTFSEVECVLLPDPGRAVRKAEFNRSGDLSLLEDEFVIEVKTFVEGLFDRDNLIPPHNLTGEGIYNILTKVDGKVADDNLSFLNIFTEHGNSTKVEKWKNSFQETVEEVQFSGLQEVKSVMFDIRSKAEQTLRGNSRTKYLAELTEALEGTLNKKVIEICFQRYKNAFQGCSSIEKQHRGAWPDEKRMLHKHLSGNRSTRENAYINFIKKAASHYYSLLHREHLIGFKGKCSMIKTLEECAGLDAKQIQSFKECEDFTNDLLNKELVYPFWLKEYQSLKHEITNTLLQKIGDITKINVDALKKLRRKQYEHFENFTLLNKDDLNLDKIPRNSKLLIAKKVGYGMFGPPTSVVNLTTVNTVSATVSTIPGNTTAPTGYSKIQESKIMPIVNTIINLSPSNNVKFSCIFLVYHKSNEIINVPIFRVKTLTGIKYIDTNCRQYTEWSDFLNSNTLPDTVYCFPLKARYIKTEGFNVAFARTPASETSKKVLKAGDDVGKGVTFVAGAAGCAVLAGVAAPAVAGVAIVGGAVGGVYGTVRGLQKIINKKKHGEKVKFKDVLNVGVNCVSVVGAAGMAVGRTLAVAAEGASIVIGTRVAAGVSSLNSLAALITSKDDTLKLISLIADVEDNSLKILFYFNTTCSKEAINIIRQSLKLDSSKSKVETLLALLENNCIQSAVETCTGDVKFEKYISQSTAKLVTSILTAVNKDVRDVVLHYCGLHSVFQSFAEENLRREGFADKVQMIMRILFEKLENEISVSKVRLINTLCQNMKFLSVSFVQQMIGLLDKEDHHLVLAFRYLLWSLISEIRKANFFFNNIEHEAITLKGHYLDDVLCHPLHEIAHQVKEIVEQTDSAVDFESTDITELNDFVLGILKLLEENSENNWSAFQFTKCLTELAKKIVANFATLVSHHKTLARRIEKVTCTDLEDLKEEIGLEGYNYGSWVSRKVLDKLREDANALKSMAAKEKNAEIILIMPAWSGILDDLYCFYKKPSNSSKLCLIKEHTNSDYFNYYNQEDYNLHIFKPCDEEIEDIPSHVVYSETRSGADHGFICSFKKKKQEQTENIDHGV